MKHTVSMRLMLPLLMLWGIGCQKPAPVQLQPAEDSEIAELTALSGNAYSPDTAGLLVPDRDRYFAELVIAGIRFDLPDETHTVSLARAIVRDRTDSIVINGSMLGYRTVDVGELFIDGLQLNRQRLRYRIGLPGFPADTVAGPFYQLLNWNGIGGRGFRYFGNYPYTWANTDTNVLINVITRSAQEIRIISPTPRDVVRVRQGFHLEWTGGEEHIYVVVSVRRGDEMRPVVRMRLRSARRTIFIPPKILQMLPKTNSSFVFSFISQSRAEASFSGYPERALVYTASVHHVLLTVQP